MKYMGLNEIREKFLNFFEQKNHKRLESFSLVPQGDNSLLLINSGMAPLKKYFTGEATPPSKRVTTCQKCIRTPDIERVGKTSRHGTYFEMLGNFSFGDYFKVEATSFAWEFCTKVMEMPIDRLFVSIYQDDDEAFEIWTKQIGVSPDKMVRLGKSDNFWEHGTGPCGPCSEIYFDRGAEYSCNSEDCKVGCDCDRYVEFWNLVFTQFDSDGNGNYTPLKNPNIDTGMGLERLACILQKVDNLFEVDTVQNIMKHICKIANIEYKKNEKQDVSLRVITDHIRSSCFMIGDGVLPSNEGRGYVLRRLIRRAARHGKLLGIDKPFLYKVATTVIEENTYYKELTNNSEYIKKVLLVEEEKFLQTLDNGAAILNQLIEQIENSGASQIKIIEGQHLFKLHDTYGFPIDLIREIAGEKNIEIDEKGFICYMEEQKQRARSARGQNAAEAWGSSGLATELKGKSAFVGYTDYTAESKILSIIVDNSISKAVTKEQKAVIILESTPFYAKSGGQASDTGFIYSKNGKFKVVSCEKAEGGLYLHTGEMIDGDISINDIVTAEIDISSRADIARNHSAVHLLQASLRQVVGDHIRQSGSDVDNTRLRFDFTHFEAVTPQQLQEVEQLVNEKILENLLVTVETMSIDKARETGAIALFDEKYGDEVRVVKMGDFSIELCGGTHVNNTSNINLFKIISESSVASGVRRIEATTGRGVYELICKNSALIKSVADTLKVQNINELPEKSKELIKDKKELEKKFEALQETIANSKIDGLFDKQIAVGGVNVIFSEFSDTSVQALRSMGDKIKEKAPKIVAVLAGEENAKANLLVVCGDEAVKLGANAGKIVKELAAMCGGSGGGKAESAMAGIPNINSTSSFSNELPNVVLKYLN